MHVTKKKFTNTIIELAIQIVFVLEFLLILKIYFPPHKLRKKMANVEAFNLNENLMQYFDYDGVDNLAMGLRDD